MKSSHTPGPWIFAYGSVYQGDQAETVEEFAGRIATMDRDNPHTIPTERDANARLIAASPELLEACKFILSQLDPNNDHPRTQCVLNSDCLSPKETDDQSVVEYLKAAILKAEGNA